MPAPSDLLPLDSPVPMILLWLITFLVCVILIDAKSMSRKVSTTIYSIAVIFGGILFGGIPNALLPIQYILVIIGIRGEVTYLLLVNIALGLLIFSSLIVGRLFCGFVCPVGALQELISKIKFKSDLNEQKEAKYCIEVSSQISSKVRWIFLGVLFLLAGVGSFAILPVINPLSGFLFLKIISLTLILPFISLIIVCFASIFLYRPWCRFLCPFGAGSAFFSRFTKKTYERTEKCIDCGYCEKICPTQEAPTHEKISEGKKGECYFCNRCVEVCPADAIRFNLG